MGKLQDIAPLAADRVRIALQARRAAGHDRPDLAPLVTVEGGPPICDTSRALLASYGVTRWRTWKAATAAGLTVDRATGVEVNSASEKALQAAWGWFVFPDSVGAVASVPTPAVDCAPVRNKGTVRALAGPSPADMAAKLRALADGLQKAIDNAFRDRETNTPKRARQAGEARNEGFQLERAQKIARALAAAWEAGTVPEVLRAPISKADLLKLAREKIDYSGGYYDSGRRTGAPAWPEDPRTAALWGLLDTTADPEREKAEKLRRLLSDLQFAKIPGYFPTPAGLVARMIEAADLSSSSHVLEPSAGSGAIANAVRDAGHLVYCIERHASLQQALTLQGHVANAPGDFMEHTRPADPEDLFDAVIMNPPFERMQDIDHVTHALGFVKPGGRLVAIMSGMTPNRSCSKGRKFLDLVTHNGGWFEDVPEGTFKESGTGVSVVMLVCPCPRPVDPAKEPTPSTDIVTAKAKPETVAALATPSRELVTAGQVFSVPRPISRSMRAKPGCSMATLRKLTPGRAEVHFSDGDIIGSFDRTLCLLDPKRPKDAFAMLAAAAVSLKAQRQCARIKWFGFLSLEQCQFPTGWNLARELAWKLSDLIGIGAHVTAIVTESGQRFTPTAAWSASICDVQPGCSELLARVVRRCTRAIAEQRGKHRRWQRKTGLALAA